MSGSRKYPYRHYPATPAKTSEAHYWVGLITLAIMVALVMGLLSHLFTR